MSCIILYTTTIALDSVGLIQAMDTVCQMTARIQVPPSVELDQCLGI